MKQTIEQIDQRIAEIDAERDDLLAARADLNAMSKDKRLAIGIHDATCRQNHTDYCSWFYEFNNGMHKWDGYAHRRYLEKAEAIVFAMPGMSIDDILKIVSMVK